MKLVKHNMLSGMSFTAPTNHDQSLSTTASQIDSNCNK